MKITDIEIKNFRAFPKTYEINLSKAGKNLLVYGENGSGKSSLYLALKYFFISGLDTNDESYKSNDFESHQNIFVNDPGYVNSLSVQILNYRKIPLSGQKPLQKRLMN